MTRWLAAVAVAVTGVCGTAANAGVNEPAQQVFRVALHTYPVDWHHRDVLHLAQVHRQHNTIARLEQELRSLRSRLRPQPVRELASVGSPGWTITAYCLHGTMADGDYTHPGAVAVDPSVVPLGSHLWVEGYGEAVAEDTGGAVIGDHVDVWLDSCSDAYAFGRRTGRVLIH